MLYFLWFERLLKQVGWRAEFWLMENILLPLRFKTYTQVDVIRLSLRFPFRDANEDGISPFVWSPGGRCSYYMFFATVLVSIAILTGYSFIVMNLLVILDFLSMKADRAPRIWRLTENHFNSLLELQITGGETTSHTILTLSSVF